MSVFAFGFGSSLGAPGVNVRTSWGDVPSGRYFVCVGGERLDQIAQSVYGVQVGAVEALLLVNPGIAALGVELPAELAVVLPELAKTTETTSREVSLWG